MATETSSGGLLSNLSDTLGTSENALRLLLSILAGILCNMCDFFSLFLLYVHTLFVLLMMTENDR